PFAFRLKGVFKKINFHIQNLPEGTQVKSHQDAHQGQKKYLRKNVEGEIIGFFSTQHQGVFTHHNQYIHMHFINKNRTEMGHIDELKFSKNSQVKLYLP
ncbi:MAG: acetolactate decarboxylase, partial [Psychroflexus maritimus]